MKDRKMLKKHLEKSRFSIATIINTIKLEREREKERESERDWMSKEAKLERNVSINPRSIMLGRGGKNLERPPSFPPLKTISDLGTQIGSEHNCQPALYMKTYYPAA